MHLIRIIINYGKIEKSMRGKETRTLVGLRLLKR